MSLLNSGVIAIKDGQLVSESDRCRQGTGGWFELEGTDIYFWGGGFGKNFNSQKKNAEKKAYPFWKLQISNRFVDHWQCNGIDFKIKLLGKDKSIALISFTYSMVFTTKIIVAKMIKREKKSLIVGSGSMSGFYRYATRSIYGSTKVFLEAFLESVHNEYPDKIDCTYFEIGAVESVLNPLKMPFKINTQQLGNTCIKYVGKYSSTTGHVMHEIPRVPYIVLPQWYKDWYANVLTNCNKSVQKH